MPNLLATVARMIGDVVDDPPPDGVPPVPTALVAVRDQLGGLQAVGGDIGSWPAALEAWLAKLKAIVGDPALRECLVIRLLQVKLPRVAESLTLAGAIKGEWAPGAAVPTRFTLDWDAVRALTRDPGGRMLQMLRQEITAIEDAEALQVLLLLLIGAPQELVRREYARQGFLALPIAAHPGVSLDELLDLVRSPVGLALPPPSPLTLDSVANPPVNGAWGRVEVHGPDLAAVPPVPFALTNGLRAQLHVVDPARARGSAGLGGGWFVDYAFAAGAGGEIVDVRMSSAGIDTAHPRPAAGASLTLRKGGMGDAFLVGEKNGTHVSVRSVAVGIRMSSSAQDPLFTWFLKLDDVEVAVAADLLSTIAMGLPLPQVLRVVAPLERTIRQGAAAAQAAAAGVPLAMEVTRHLGLAIGSSAAGLWVDDVLVRVEVAVPGRAVSARIMVRFAARAALGPVRASMTGVGAWVGRWTGGNAGVLPPDGIGLTLQAGPIDGGGFLQRYGPGRFGGALQLKVLGIGVFAYGLYDELPGAVSIAAIIGIRLPPPGIQIGFGFAVSGVGGLIGVNRRADTDALRARLQSGTAGDVLFTDDPVRNAPRLLGEMAAMFPAERGVHVFGPTLQLNWAELLRLDIGLFIELPGPRQIFLAGSARLVIGSDDFALVRIRVDFVGGVDLTSSLIWFDGMLVNSTVLGIITITGGVALRIGFGGNPYFLYSVGGFHPSFDPGDLPLPVLPRAGASVSLGIVWFKQETYLAITSNTLQFGAKTEAGVEIGPIGVHGWFGFDALIQYRPFFFVATVDAGMAASFEGWSFASIRVQGTLKGPGPLVLHAKASVRILVKISKSVTITIDDNPPEALPPVPPLAELIRPDLSDPSTVRVEGSDPDVVFAQTPGIGARLVPLGRVVWEQKRIPLHEDVERAGGRDLPQRSRVEVHWDGHADSELVPEFDLFGHGTFAKLTDADALAAPVFVSCRSGFAVPAVGLMQSGGTALADTTLAIVRLPERRKLLAAALAGLGFAMSAALHQVIAQRLGGAPVATESPVVAVVDERWDVVGGAAPATAVSAFSAVGAARTAGGAAVPAGAAPMSLAGVMT